MSTSNYLIPPEVTVALNQLPIIQSSLRDISLQLADLNVMKSKIDQVKADLWETDGIDHRLQNTAQMSEDNYGDIQSLKQINLDLRQEVDLLKSVVVRLDKRVTEQESEIIELKNRSMRENILIHNLAEQEGENLHARINSLFKEHFDLDVKFVRIHRNGGKPLPGKPRSITGRLVDFGQKEMILKAQKVNVNNKIQLPFHVTPQSPPSLNENRKKLFEVSTKYRAEGVNTRVVGTKMVFPNGSTYFDKVTVPNAKDILSIDQNEREKLDNLKVELTNHVSDNGNKFLAIGAQAKCFSNVKNLYKKVASDALYASADHKIMVYRFHDEQGKLHEGYNDDNEHGSGRRLLKKFKDNNVIDVSVVVVRYFSGKHIGPRRFTIMEDLAMEASVKVRTQ